MVDDPPDGGTGTNPGEALVLFGSVDGVETPGPLRQHGRRVHQRPEDTYTLQYAFNPPDRLWFDMNVRASLHNTGRNRGVPRREPEFGGMLLTARAPGAEAVRDRCRSHAARAVRFGYTDDDEARAPGSAVRRGSGILDAARTLDRGDSVLVFPSIGGKRLHGMALSRLLKNQQVAAVPHGLRSSVSAHLGPTDSGRVIDHNM